MSRRFACCGSVLAILLVCALTLGVQRAAADELYAHIRGVVTDSTGAPMPGAEVKVTNVATGATQQVVSDSDGDFEFVKLRPGIYNLAATKSGFKTFRVDKIEVGVNRTYVQNIAFEVGSLTETVEVVANPAQVEQTSIQLGATITAGDLGTMPILNRNWISLQQTLPGVYSSDRFSNNFSTNGSQSQQNSYLVNGTDSNDLPINTPLILPSPDAIAEVHMITNTINPEYGRNSGAIMNAILKSGTNTFHGTAFESFRDTSLNVHDFFHLHPTPYHQNIYGGTVGGPIVKNKTYFFFSLQIDRHSQPSPNASGTTTVFNPATGAYGGVGSAPLSAFATLGACTSSGACLGGPNGTNTTPFALTGSNGTVYPAGTLWRTVFAGGTVPTSDYNALSRNLINQFVPRPNFTSNQFTFNPIRAIKDNQYLGTLDQNFGQKDSIKFSAFAENNSRADDVPFTGSTLPGFGDHATSFQKQFTAAWNHTFSPNLLNEFRVGYTRLNFDAVEPQVPVTTASLGFPDIHQQLTGASAGAPLISLTGYFTLGFSNNGPQPRKDQTYQITENMSWQKGRHTLKFGYEGRRFDVWNPFGNTNNGHYTFDSSGTYSTGDPGLDYLLGIPQQYAQGSGAIIIARAYEHYFYAQDQWRLRNNLTVTVGTGYQIDTPIEEYQYNGLGRPCLVVGQQSRVFATAPVGYNFPGDPGCNKAGGATTKYTHFGPRIGFAYSPEGGWLSGGPGKTSIRAGFGIYYNRSEEEQNLQDLGNPPFGLGSTGVSDAPLFGDPSWPNPWVDIAGLGSIPNKFPYTRPAPGSPVDFSFFYPFGISMSEGPNRTVPYAMNYNLTVQRELPARTILTLGYVGAQGRKLVVSKPFNYATPQGVAACLASLSCRRSPSFATVHPVMSLPGNYVLPPTVWGNSGTQYNGGTSNFHSLQITVEKHTTHGLGLHATYAWAHSLDETSSFEDTSFNAAGNVDVYGNLRRDYGDSAFDGRHRVVGAVSYDLPNLNRIVSWMPSRVFGGWRIAGINTYQTGFPIIFQDTRNRSLTCSTVYRFYGCPDRPDLVFQPQQLDPRTATFNGKTNYFFNPDNALGTEGTTRRGQLHGPGFWNLDMSLQKETAITERIKIALSADAFNIFNHANFARPTASFSSSNFGRVTAVTGSAPARIIQLGAKFIF